MVGLPWGASHRTAPAPFGIGWLRSGSLRLLFRVALLVGTGFVPGPPLRAQALAMRHFDHRDGLPQSQVTALLEDRHGFIWASTSDGLVRIGAIGTQVFDASNGLAAKNITCLLEDRTGGIWAGSRDQGLARIRGLEVTAYGPEQGIPYLRINCLCETRQGELLAGTHRGLFRMKGERFEAVTLPQPWAASAITALAEDARGGLWLGLRNGPLARWDGTRLEPAALGGAVLPGAVRGLAQDPSGRMWALKGAHLLQRGAEGVWAPAVLPGLPAGAASLGFSLDPRGGLLLVLGSSGLYQLEADGTHRLLKAGDLLCREAILCALRDRHGGLWLGTDGDYLWAQALQGLHNLSRQPGTGTDLGLGSVTAFLELPGRGMLLGSNNGVFLWQEGRGLVRRWTQGHGAVGEDVWRLLPDGQGGSWVGTMRGLFRLGPGNRLLPGPKELEANMILCLVRQGRRLWVGTDQGLAELDEQGRFLARHLSPEEPGYQAIQCLIPWAAGLLCGTDRGLYGFKDGTFQVPFPQAPFQSRKILAVQEDGHGRLWVGTPQGLAVASAAGGAWSNLGLQAGGQPLYFVYWIRTLSDGTVALGHGKGVTLVAEDGSTFHLTQRMGLISDETNQGAAFEDARGRLWFGMVGGACILDRLAAFPTLPEPMPVVLDVAWEQGYAWAPTRLALPPGRSSLTIHVDAGLPNAPFPLLFQTKLDAMGTSWRALEPGLGTLQFGGLNQGVHRLDLRASLQGKDWREAPPLLVTIRPAWYQTLWARDGLAFLVILGALGLIRMRFLRIRSQNRTLEAKVQVRTQELAHRNQSLEWTHSQLKATYESRMGLLNTVSHDLRSPLTTILLCADQILATTEPVSPKVAKALEIMTKEAMRLEAIVKGLLDRSRADSIADRLCLRPASPGAILENLEETLRLKAESMGLRSHFHQEETSRSITLALDVVAMQQVVFNLVENALKFTPPPGDVGVRSSLAGEHWVLEVWDSGRGIAPAECKRLFASFEQGHAIDAHRGWGLGLFICQSIVAAHHGHIEVASEPGKGARFQVFLPLVQAPHLTPEPFAAVGS